MTVTDVDFIVMQMSSLALANVSAMWVGVGRYFEKVTRKRYMYV